MKEFASVNPNYIRNQKYTNWMEVSGGICEKGGKQILSEHKMGEAKI